ncbi:MULTISPECIES: YlxR family protein [Bacillaceae]|uniref:RNase P modulator RnpM n=1 Tax=Bacillaceae TaxID=186817 RepID=UPI000BA5FA27|nr:MULTISPECIES: YlxR family protein [Bacillaceae]PAE26871.1 RNA-binding protein [Bacillus sp. 7894-2]URM31678.1 YlxR family protein [Cytobacillus firmus]
MNNRKKVPLRKCVATGEMRPKKELVRIVRSKEGEVSVDPTGKKSGRGAYLSKEKEAVLLAKKKNILANHLEVSIDDAVYEDLLELIEKEKRQSK